MDPTSTASDFAPEGSGGAASDEASAAAAAAAKQQGKPKRTYRACQPCRARKLKCDLGDPEAPSDPPCKRCRRESRECVFVLRANAKSYLDGLAPTSAEGTPAPPPYTATPPQRPTKRLKTGHSSVSPPVGNGPAAGGADEAPEPSAGGSGTGKGPAAQTTRVPTPHLGGWSAPPSTRASYVPTRVASPASEPAAQAGPSRLTELYRDSSVASTSTAEHSGGGGYDPRNPHLRHPGLARASNSGPPTVGEPISSATSTDGYDEDEDEQEERGRSRQTGSRGGNSGRDANVLLSSTLHNPSDALRLLATASSLRSAEAFAYKAEAMSDSRSRGGSNGLSIERRASSGSRERRRSSRSRERPAGINPSPLASVVPGDGPLLEEAEEAREGVEPSREEQRSVWQRWVPIQEGMVSISEAEALLAFFKDHMAHLYPLLLDRIFEPVHLPALTSRESLLLAAMITISARYSSLPSRSRARMIHEALAEYCRDELVGILDGSGAMRHISSVEALLLLTEWPPITVGRAQKGSSRSEREGRSSSRRRTGWGRGRSATRVDQRDQSNGRAEERPASGSRQRGGFGNSDLDEDGTNEENAEALLRSSAQYDGMSWSFIGCAVRLAQELGISNIEFDSAKGTSLSWEEERRLRTWIYCYNADRHVSVRLGRNAVIQAYMSSSWWEQVTNHASHGVRREGGSELWAERTLPQGLIAALMGTIQERLYPNKEITRSMLRTGHWESFIRSLDHELRMMLLKSQNVLQQGNIESTLLQMEFEYVRLYGNAIALRALQERLRRAVKANDLWFVSPSLLNLQEGQWILDALAAAQSILDRTVNFLAPKGYLRLAPSRLHQRILFASTFLFKALAVGVVEHGQSKVLGLLNQTITVLRDNASDRQHIACGFAALLRRLQAQCKPTLFSRFGVRVQDGGEANANGAAAAPTPAAAPPADHASPVPEGSQSHAPLDPVLAPTPDAGGTQPPSAAATPRFNIPGLPPVAEAGPSALDPATGLPLSQPFAPITPHLQPMSAGTSSALPPWLAGAGEPAIEMGGFRLGDVFAPVPSAAGGLGDPSVHGHMRSIYEWDPMSHSIQVGHEQDLLFQSLWGGGGMASGGEWGGMGSANPALNLFGTLVGDE
ncbi:hypothetical protein JCM10908_001053 [Rhodotorula pacifica]|uniref:uncharacterized protein n=1 Tax=Rhodotorula pacifica TaxID=1495444 RepID=UPI00317E07FD